MKTWIPINDDYAVTANEYGWVLKRRQRHKETGEPTDWDGRTSYFTNFDALVKSLGHEMLSRSGAQSIDELVEAAAKISSFLTLKLKSSMEVDYVR